MLSKSIDELKQLNKKAKICTDAIQNNIASYLQSIAEEEKKLQKLEEQHRIIMIAKFKKRRAEFLQAKEELAQKQKILAEISKILLFFRNI